jgi:hypothetical protein
MPRENSGSSYENRQRAVELEDNPAHTHRVGEQQGKQEHLTGGERTRQNLEHERSAHPQTSTATVGHGIVAFGHEEIAARAYELWQARGCPEGSPQEDWFRATEELRSRKI